MRETNYLVGQQRIKEILSASIKRNRMAHAYLFHGQAGVGKDAAAIALAKKQQCSQKAEWGCGQCETCRKIERLEYPEFRWILPVPGRPKTMKEDKYREILREKALSRLGNPYRKLTYQPELKTLPTIGIDQIRSLKKEMMLKIPKEQVRVVVISQADKMTVPAANSLLKLLEEPPDRTLIVLTSSAYKRILPTIVSRCQILRFNPLPEEEIEQALRERWGIQADQAELIASLSGGSLERALDLNEEDYEKMRSLAFQYLNSCLSADVLKRIEFSEKLLIGRDKAGIMEIFHILLIYLRDILTLRIGEREKLINKDRIRELCAFTENYRSFDVNRAIDNTERAIDFIEKNVYLHLIIQSLSTEIYRCKDGQGF
jgi:DNA polymerase-3 subunit delta'